MSRVIVIALMLLPIIACNNSLKENNTTIVDSTKQAGVLPNNLPASDTLIVKTKSAVVYSPDSLRLEKEIKKAGRENFQIGYDDYAYYINEASTFLQGKGIRVDTTTKKWIAFQSTNGTHRLIKTDTPEGLFGIFLFDGISEPGNMDIIQAELEYNIYFNSSDSLKK